MTCHELETDLALYAGGDLIETSAAEAHLAACAGCRALVDDLRGVRDDLSGLRDVALPSLPSIRPRRAPRWPWAAGAIAAGLALFAIPRPIEVAPPRPVAWAPPAPAVELPPPRPVLRVKPRPVQPPAPETEFAKILTEDDDVVILWALNTKGEPH